MDFEWDSSALPGSTIPPREIEESFEDPFSIRIMPEFSEEQGSGNRYFLLGRSVSGRALFSVFWTDGKRYRVIQSREMTEAESAFYDRRNSDPGN